MVIQKPLRIIKARYFWKMNLAFMYLNGLQEAKREQIGQGRILVTGG